MVSETSVAAFHKVTQSGRARTQRETIIECVRDSAVPLTRRMISVLTGLPINVVTARVNSELPKKDQPRGRLHVAYTDVDLGTGYAAQYIEAVVPPPAQRRFEW